MTIIALPDLVGDNQVHSMTDLLTAAGLPVGSAVMLVIREITGGAASSRVGDANVGPGRGIPLSAADSLVLPGYAAGLSLSSLGWDLTGLYIYAANGDTLAIAYASF